MKRTCTTLFAAIVSLLSTGCQVFIYQPQAVDIPLINHQGDTRVDAAVGLSTFLLPNRLTLNATGTYGITDWLAAQAHIDYGFDCWYGQVAPGAYLPLSEHAVLEGYVGFGGGGSWNDGVVSDSGYTLLYKGSFALPFAQANFGWHDLANGHLDIGFGLKTGYYFPSFDYQRYKNHEHLVSYDEHYGNRNLLLEPQLMLRVGGPKVKYCLRLSYAWMSDLPEGAVSFSNDFFTISNGITFSF